MANHAHDPRNRQRTFGRTDPAALTRPGPKAALAYWEEKRGSEALPPVSSIAPAEIPRLLADIVLIDVLWGDDPDSPEDFTYRLIGQNSIEAHGQNVTGLRISDPKPFGPEYAKTMLGFYRAICRSRKPMAASGRMDLVEKEFRRFEAIYLPFADETGRVSRVMTVAAYY